MAQQDEKKAENPIASLGGKAAAAKLSPAERRERARRAADARWSADLPQAVCGSPDRPLVIAGVEIQAYVLEDGTRVLTQGDFQEALGRHRKANVRKFFGEEPVPAILQGERIKPFIGKELMEKSEPIPFRTPQGTMASGYRAEILPEVCEVFLKARDAKALQKQQEHIAVRAGILVRGLARVGIIALVDEATGYQEMRAKDALTKILEAFVAKELRKWVKTFPADFYRELFRLRGLKYGTGKVKSPSYIGHLTNDLVYSRLAPGVLQELKEKNPITENGYRKSRHHQWLTADIGHPKLLQHLSAVIALMKVSADGDYSGFKKLLDRALPKQIECPLYDNLPQNGGSDD